MLSRLLASQLRQPILQQQQVAAAAAVACAAAASAAVAPPASAAGNGLVGSCIRWFCSSEEAGNSSSGGSSDLKRLYVGNLAFEATKEEVEQAFAKFGSVHECHLPTRPDGRHRGFGFVAMEPAAAEAAMESLNQAEISGRPIHVKEAEAKGTRPQRSEGRGFGGGGGGGGGSYGERRPRAEMFVRPGFTRLYVGNLNFRTSAADLGRHFQQFGAVQDCVIPLDPAGRSRGYGFVELDLAGAAKAAEALNGSQFDGRTIVVRDQQ